MRIFVTCCLFIKIEDVFDFLSFFLLCCATIFDHSSELFSATQTRTHLLNSLHITTCYVILDNMLEITNLVPKIDKGRLYRGKGGEQFRQASCLLIENIAKCHLTMLVKTQLHLLDLVNENLKQPHSVLRESAASALR